MSDTSIQLLSEDSLKAVYLRQESGKMADTYACHVEWDNGVRTNAFVKRFKNTHTLGLVNEITGYILAKGCNLPVPKFVGLIRTSNEHFSDESNIYNEWCFLTSELDGETPLSFYEVNDMEKCQSLMNLIANWSKVHDAIAFDDWIANEDRHIGNIMVAGKDKIYLFDHSNIPINLNWNPKKLDPHYNARSVLTDNLYKMQCTLPMKSRVASAISLHADVYEKVKEELFYWWDIFLDDDNERRVAIEIFLEKRALLGSERVCDNLRMLA